MTLLLLGGPLPSLANRFGFGAASSCSTSVAVRCKLSRLRQGALASVICVDMGVVLSSRDGYVGEAVVDQQLAFLGVHVD
jgi:hypothetical protein